MLNPIYVIDTHPLVWYFEDSPRLSSGAREAFDQIEYGKASGIIPTIVLAELVHLADKQRVSLNIHDTIDRIRVSSNYGIVSLNLTVILLMIPLKDYKIHDRVIVATTKSFEASLITKDEQIRKSKDVTCIW